MTSNNNYFQIVGSIVVLSGLVFFGFYIGQSKDEQHSVSEGEELKHLPIAAKSTPFVSPRKSDADDSKVEETKNPFEGQEVKARFQQVAEQFADEIQYPAFSKPIRGEHELSKYLPNRSVSVNRPINLDDANAQAFEYGPKISLKTSKFRYYKGESVFAEAEVSGLTEVSSISVSAKVIVDRKVVAMASEVTRLSDAEDHNSYQYSMRFNDLSDFASDTLGDMTVVAEFTIDGQPHAISTLVRYPSIVATLDHVGDAEVQEEYLIIPVHVSTSSPGLFALGGNLYDTESNTPLVHLNAIKELSSESGVIQLKAHISALKKMGKEGPYQLKDISLSRGPSAPKFVMEQGLVDIDSVYVAGFPFSDYEDIPYVDERAQARLEFLTQLGSMQ